MMVQLGYDEADNERGFQPDTPLKQIATYHASRMLMDYLIGHLHANVLAADYLIILIHAVSGPIV